MTSKQEFERWYMARYRVADFALRPDSGARSPRYQDETIDAAWCAWSGATALARRAQRGRWQV